MKPWRILSVLLLAPPASGKTVDLEDLLAMRVPVATAISPRGESVLCTYLHFTPEGENEVQLLVPAGGGTPRVLLDYAARQESQPRWSPDGSRIAFLSTETAEASLKLLARDGKTEALATAAGGIESFSWSPDGRSIAYVYHPEPRGESDWPPNTRHSRAPEKPRLALVDLGSRAHRDLPTGSTIPADPSFSPDGRSVAFGSDGVVAAVALKDGSVRILGRDLASRPHPKWSPDGRRIACVTSLGLMKGAGIGIVGSSGGVVPGSTANFDAGFGSDPPFFEWIDDSTLAVSHLWHMTQRLEALSIRDGSVRSLTSPNTVAHGFSLTSDRKTVAFLGTAPKTPDEVWVSPLRGFAPRRMTDLNPQLRDVSFADARRLTWKGAGGVDVEGLVMTPASSAPGPFPTLILMEGSFGTFDLSFTARASADRNVRFPFQQQLFASHGYAVLMPNPRGSWGYGQEFRQLARGDIANGPAQDIVSGLDRLVADGIADPRRVGIMGLWIDGYRAAVVASRDARIGAACIGNGFFDLWSWYGVTGGGDGYLAKLVGDTPAVVPERYDEFSPVRQAAGLKAATLLFHTREPHWAEDQARELETALIDRKVPVERVGFQGSATQQFNAEQWSASVRRIVEWFDRWLLKDEGKK